MPAGCEPQANPALKSFSEPEPGVGFPLVQAMVMLALLGKMADGNPKAFHAAFTISEFSPKFGARNEVPQPPLKVRSVIGSQLKPTFQLVVPPKSLYWSWRPEASRSNLCNSGKLYASLKTGMFN